ncbi:hypothetical protein C8F04DRAFT_1180623 [Mycena alexandri]|uniref:Uncharacterized protein n=1 Tax=Mycena alexandri TaxID=1745969 RepID=A0AAD6T1T2_9AGAR|nr:hypothetical protein C8F04DRAFT_1180623 [Mycena alexandri]
MDSIHPTQNESRSNPKSNLGGGKLDSWCQKRRVPQSFTDSTWPIKKLSGNRRAMVRIADGGLGAKGSERGRRKSMEDIIQMIESSWFSEVEEDIATAIVERVGDDLRTISRVGDCPIGAKVNESLAAAANGIWQPKVYYLSNSAKPGRGGNL